MPIETPFHERTSQLCTSLLYKDWAGCYAVRSYDTYPDREYYAFRHAAGLIDVTPLFKYDVYGEDAAAFLSRIMVRNINKLKVGQVFYCCWCNDDGKVVDDGTVARIDDGYFRVTSADPSLSWFLRFTRGYDVTVEDSTQKIAALSLQGPRSRDILRELVGTAIDDVKYFWLIRAKIGEAVVYVTRTGYTGDLGFEVWMRHADALPVWDALMETGGDYGMLPVGLDAMDITRIEAGYILNGVDYYNANHSLIESRKSTPYELGLGWMVRVKRAPFNGQQALIEEKRRGPARVLVCLDIDWDEYESLFAARGLPAEISTAAWRTSVPVYDDTGKQVGYANSGSWSPILKKNLALATVNPSYRKAGTRLKFEVTVEYERKTVTATVIKKPAFDPERKKL